MKYFDELVLAGKRVFVRADLNVPLAKDGSIADDNRIRASLPTISHVLSSGGSVVLCSHLGRPEGVDPKFSLKPVAARLEELLKTKVTLAPDCVGPETHKLAASLPKGEVLLLENVRFHSAEEENKLDFAKELASLADVYINDAFATAHRKHASTAGIAQFFTEKGAGYTVKTELTFFNKAFANPIRPFAAIFGGAKVSTKMKAIRFAGVKADKVIIGGAMANTFFVAQGLSVGKSLYEPEEVENAKATIAALKEADCEILLPVDLVVANEMKAKVSKKIVKPSEIPSDTMALDVGPETDKLFTKALSQSATIVWNGPMGAFEIEDFSTGTYNIVDTLAESQALTVVGGGDTDLALHQKHAYDKMSYVSTAGGAFLKLLEGGTLAAVKALEE
jgi:phosphoglycerate kinase